MYESEKGIVVPYLEERQELSHEESSVHWSLSNAASKIDLPSEEQDGPR